MNAPFHLVYSTDNSLHRIQPVYVIDVAAAILAALKDDGTSMGKVYELGGPEVLTVHDLVISLLFRLHMLHQWAVLTNSNCNTGRAYV